MSGSSGDGCCFATTVRPSERYSVDFWINLPGANDFSMFFQYVGAKVSSSKGLSPTYRKGILRVL